MKNNDRCLQFFEVGGHVFAEVMKGGIYYFDSILPDDAEYVTTHHDFHSDIFLVLFKSSHFDEVQEGCRIPSLDLCGLITKIEAENEMPSS